MGQYDFAGDGADADFQIMQEQGSQLFKEIGQDLAQALQNGREFSQTITTYPFFKKELSLIIEYGKSSPSWGVSWKSTRKRLGNPFLSESTAP